MGREQSEAYVLNIAYLSGFPDQGEVSSMRIELMEMTASELLTILSVLAQISAL